MRENNDKAQSGYLGKSPQVTSSTPLRAGTMALAARGPPFAMPMKVAGAAGHDLREQLQALMLLHELLAHYVEGAMARHLLTRIEQTLGTMSALVDPPALDLDHAEAIEPPAPPPERREGSGQPVVHVVEHNAELRSAIRAVLESDGRLVRDHACAESFLKAYRPGENACLLVGARMQGMSGISLIQLLRSRRDLLPAILITGGSSVSLAVAAMRTGACDLIEQPVTSVEILASIARAVDRTHHIRRRDAARAEAVAQVADLTARQREIMILVLAGHPSKNIAADLCISQRTVENHRAAIMRKMGARSLPELARRAQTADLPLPPARPART